MLSVRRLCEVYARHAVGVAVAGIDSRIRSAVHDTVTRHVDAGIDVVSDGEQGKISYVGYVKDRLTDFDGEPTMLSTRDMHDHPDFVARLAAQLAPTRFAHPTCTKNIWLPAWSKPPATSLSTRT